MARKLPKKKFKPLAAQKEKVAQKDYEVGKNKPPKDTRFKKGAPSPNPNGCKGNLTDEEWKKKRALKELTNKSVKEAIETTFTCTEGEIKKLLDDPETTAGHKILLRAALNAVENGEYDRFDRMLERAVGKVVIKIDNTSGGKPLNDLTANKELVRSVIKEIENQI